MRVSNTPKRHRSRNNSRRNSNSQKNNPYDNKDTKIKGNAIQVHEKYQSLARDAITSGDIIKAEYYFQHAEHYHRVHKLSQSHQIEKRQKNVVKIHNEELNDEKNKNKLEEKTDISSKEDNLTNSGNKEIKKNTEENTINK
tara:strand:+ start:161 stop:583 length:423 start_codon:yes stop_codon:yes gene_type:complete